MKNHYNINGNKIQLIFTIHHFSKPLIKIYQKLTALKELSLYVHSVIQSLLTIFHLQETFLKNLQLLDIYSIRKLNKMTSTLMVQEEEMIKLWLEEHSQTQESLTNLLIKLVHKLNTYQLDKSWISVMPLSNIKNKVTQLLF